MEEFSPLKKDLMKKPAESLEGVAKFAILVRDARRAQGKTLEIVVKELNQLPGMKCTIGTVNKWESRLSPGIPAPEKLPFISQVLGVPLEDLILARNEVVDSIKQEKEMRGASKDIKVKTNKDFEGYAGGGSTGHKTGTRIE